MGRRILTLAGLQGDNVSGAAPVLAKDNAQLVTQGKILEEEASARAQG
jgi:hypothetical protein